MLYWATSGGQLQRAKVSGGDVEDVYLFANPPAAIEIDEQRCLIYVSMYDSQAIVRMQLHGLGEPEPFIDLSSYPNTDYAKDMWLDKDTETLYWATYYSRLMRTPTDPGHLNNGVIEEYATDSKETVMALAVNTTNSAAPRIFLSNPASLVISSTEWGGNGQVRAFIDSWADGGTDILETPGDLSFAASSQQLFYIDSTKQEIRRCVDNSSSDVVATGQALANMLVHESSGTMFWSDRQAKNIHKADLDGNAASGWPLDVGRGSEMPNAGMAFFDISKMNPECYASTTTTTTISTTTSITSTTTLTTTTTSTTTVTVTNTTTTTTTFTTSTTSTNSSTTTISTTRTSTTTTSNTTTSTTTTSNTTTSTITTSTTTTATTTTSNTTTSTTTVSTTTTSTTTNSTTTTSTTTVSTTTTSTITSTTTSTNTSTTTTSRSTTTTTTITTTTTSTMTTTSTTETSTTTTTTSTTITTSTTRTTTSSTTTWTSTSTSLTSTKGTVTTTTSTPHTIAVFVGTILCVVSNATDAVADFYGDPVVEPEVRAAIANSVEGVMPHHVSLPVFRINGRALDSGEGALHIEWVVKLSMKEVARYSLFLGTFADAEAGMLKNLREVFESIVGVEIYNFKLNEPTYDEEESISTTTTLTTVTTTSTTETTDFKVVMVGSLSFSGDGLDAEDVETATQAAVANKFDVSLESVAVSITDSVARRLATTWTVRYTLTVVPVKGIKAAEGIDATEMRKALVDSLVVTSGLPREQLDASLDLIGVSAPSMSTILNSPAALAACGPSICDVPNMVLRVDAPESVCFEAFSCEEGRPLCCQATVPEPMPFEETEQPISVAASAWLAVAVGVLVVSAALVVLRRGMRAFRITNEHKSLFTMPAWLNDLLSGKTASNSLILDMPCTLPDTDSPENADQLILEQLLYELQGNWRPCDEQGSLLESSGSIQLGSDGRALVEGGRRCEAYDLRVDEQGIVRGDGWFMDMQRSDADHMEWWRDDAEAVSIWKRPDGVSSFAIGDGVEWLPKASGEVAAGTRGRVAGFADTRLKVEVDGKVHQVLPTELARLAGHSHDEATLTGGAVAGSRPRGLPSLALCAELRRIGLHVKDIARNYGDLNGDNADLHLKLTDMSADLASENLKLAQELAAAEDTRRDLTSRLAAETKGLASPLETGIATLAEDDDLDLDLARQNERLEAQLRQMQSRPSRQGRPAPLEFLAGDGGGSRAASPKDEDEDDKEYVAI